MHVTMSRRAEIVMNQTANDEDRTRGLDDIGRNTERQYKQILTEVQYKKWTTASNKK